VIDRLVILGGTGDLTGRYLLPGLAALVARRHLSEGFEIVAASREDWDDEQYETGPPAGYSARPAAPTPARQRRC
jgi:glucose-6-phosphate 1-dehydrogenase